MLVLDFGGPVQPADRPPGARGTRLLRAGLAPARRRGAPRSAAARTRPVGRPCLGLRRRRPARRSGDLRARRADAGHLLRDAADGPGARRDGRVERGVRVREGRRRASVVRRAVPRSPARPGRLDEPPRLGDGGAARRARHGVLRRRRRSRRSRTRSASSTPSSSTPRSSTRRRASEMLESFLYDVAGAPPSWTPAAVIEEQVERIRAQVGSEQGHLRALRRRRLRGRGAARAQGRRRPAHLRVRRPRPPARERGRAGRRDVRPVTSTSRSSTSTRASGSLAGWPA